MTRKELRPKLLFNRNFNSLVDEFGLNGTAKEWGEIKNSNELLRILELKGATEYIKKLRLELSKRGFYNIFFK